VQTNEAERRRWNDDRWAALWPKREPMTDAVSPFVLEAAALEPGERVLEVGSGGGRLSLAAARAVGPRGSVTGADLSTPLGALSRTRAREAGVENVSFHTVDMQTDTVPGAPFDAAVSQFGVMFFDDPVRAFGNIRSQLVPGGRIAFACWQRLEDNRWHFASAISEFLPPAAPTPEGTSAPGPFSLADPKRTTSLLEQAGFGQVERTPHERVVDVPAGSVYDDIQLSLMGVAPEQHAAAHAAVERYLQQFAVSPDVTRIPLAFQVFTARST
jgi:SAM-dependent methyltransferase